MEHLNKLFESGWSYVTKSFHIFKAYFECKKRHESKRNVSAKSGQSLKNRLNANELDQTNEDQSLKLMKRENRVSQSAPLK